MNSELPFDEHREAVLAEMRARLRQVPARKRVQWRVGRRGAYLALTGLIFVLLGYTYGVDPLPAPSAEQLAGPLSLVPDIRIWAVAWVFTGTVAIVTAWWPPGSDGVGFAALWIYSSVWGVMNLMGALALEAPRAHITGLVFLAMAVSVLIVSGMTDHTPVARMAEEEHRDAA